MTSDSSPSSYSSNLSSSFSSISEDFGAIEETPVSELSKMLKELQSLDKAIEATRQQSAGANNALRLTAELMKMSSSHRKSPALVGSPEYLQAVEHTKSLLTLLRSQSKGDPYCLAVLRSDSVDRDSPSEVSSPRPMEPLPTTQPLGGSTFLVKVNCKLSSSVSGLSDLSLTLMIPTTDTVESLRQLCMSKVLLQTPPSFHDQLNRLHLQLFHYSKQLTSSSLVLAFKGLPLTLKRSRHSGSRILPISRAVALFPYSCPTRSDVLSFQKDDVIEILDKIEPTWWIARLDGRRGLIPAPYVREIQDASPSTIAPSPLQKSVSRRPDPQPSSLSSPASSTPASSPVAISSSSSSSSSAPAASSPLSSFSSSQQTSLPSQNSAASSPPPSQQLSSSPASSSAYPQTGMVWMGGYNAYATPVYNPYSQAQMMYGAQMASYYGGTGGYYLGQQMAAQQQAAQQQAAQQQADAAVGTSDSLVSANPAVPSSSTPADPSSSTSAAETASPIAPPRQQRGIQAPELSHQTSSASIASYLLYGRDTPTVPPRIKHTRKERREQKAAFHRLLAQLVANDKSVTTLRLRGCKFSTTSAKKLCSALQVNSTVTSIDLSHLGFASSEDLMLLVALLRKSQCQYQEINLISSGATLPFVRKFEDSMKTNFSLRKVSLFTPEELDFKRDELHTSVRNIEEFAAQNVLFADYSNERSNHFRLSHRGLDRIDADLLLTRLTLLDISSNMIEEFPAKICTLINLHTLQMQHNFISQIPEEIGNLKKLKSLNLAANKLAALPEALHTLSKLVELSIASNLFTTLPDFMPHMRGIQKFDCSLNKLKNVPKALLARGDKLVLSYLRELHSATKQCYKMKILTVGQGNVGKTSLLSTFFKMAKGKTTRSSRKLRWKREESKTSSKANVATDGIDITDVQVKSKRLPDPADRLELSLWDFAGQDVYCTTHNFFLSGRAIYVMVFDMVNLSSISNLEYWFNSISVRAPDSPVIIVGTHLDDPLCTPEYIQQSVWPRVSEKARQLKNLFCCIALSAKSGLGVSEFIDSLYQCVLAQPSMPEPVPLTYLKLEETIRALSTTQPTLSLDEFTVIASRSGIHADNVPLVTTFLTDTGTICYFPEQNPDLVVLHPQWITDTFSTIITLKANFVKQGFLLHSDLPQIWKPPLFPTSHHPFLISLLEKFDLIYHLPGSPADAQSSPSMEADRYFIPALLQSEAPDADLMQVIWPPPEEHEKFVGRTYSFKFIPVGFFARIIVRFCRSFTWQPVFYWQHGLVVSLNSHQALLFVEKNIIKIRIRGRQPGSYIGPFCENINTLVAESLRLSFSVSIPCSHCLAMFSEFEPESPDPFSFDLSTCEHSVASNRSFVLCRGTTPISLTDLAPDISLSDYRDSTISFSDIAVHEVIGIGGYATVYRAEYDGQAIALKKIQLSLLPGEQTARSEMLRVFAEFRREVQLMTSLRHEYVVALKGVVLDPFCLALEFMGLGNLFDMIHDGGIIMDWPMRVELAAHISKGMSFIHSLEMIHRDLKSPNILLKWDNNSVVAKIADFGLSRKLSLTPTLVEKSVDNPVWLAPEILQHQPYDQRVDTYAFGVILYELLERKAFFGECAFMAQLENRVIAGERPALTVTAPPALADYLALMRECWSQKPEERPAFSTIQVRLDAVFSHPQLPARDPKALKSVQQLLDLSDSITTSDQPAAKASPRHQNPLSPRQLQQIENRDLDEHRRQKLLSTRSHSGASKRQSMRVVVARALWDFEGMGPDELSFTKGTIIHVTEFDGDFLRGKSTVTELVGWFQADYVERLDLQSTVSPDNSPGNSLHAAKVIKSPNSSFHLPASAFLDSSDSCEASQETVPAATVTFFVPSQSPADFDASSAKIATADSEDSGESDDSDNDDDDDDDDVPSAVLSIEPVLSPGKNAHPAKSVASLQRAHVLRSRTDSSPVLTLQRSAPLTTKPHIPTLSSSDMASAKRPSSAAFEPPADGTSSSPSQSALPRLVAIASFVAQRSDMLTFSKGDIIELVQKNTVEWWTGIHNGTKGLFPGPYTKPTL
ncbi:MAG: protein kinase [archaeon]|nr:protein kinase [archaeon]